MFLKKGPALAHVGTIEIGNRDYRLWSARAFIFIHRGGDGQGRSNIGNAL